MMDFKAARDFYIPVDNVDYYVGYSSKSVQKDIKRRREEGTVFDYTCGKKINTVIYLKTGNAILVNTTVDTINARRDSEGREKR